MAKGTHIGTFLSVFLLSATLWAAPGDNDTIATHVSLDSFTVRGHHILNRASSSTPVQRMERDEFTKQGLQNVADVARRFAGTLVRDYGGIGGMKTLSVRSMGASHTAVSYDGVAVSNCQAGQIDIGRFSLNNVSEISLSLGQDDDLMQPVRLQASGAVLSIKTDDALPSARRSGRVLLRGGSFGQGEGLLSCTRKIGSRTSITALGEYTRADGNYPFTLENGSLSTHERRENSHIYSVRGEADLLHLFNDSSRLKVKGYYYYSRRGLPGAVILYNNTSLEKLWDENFFLQAQYHKDFSARWHLQSQAKYNHSWNYYRDEGGKYASTGGVQRDINRQDEGYLQSTLLYEPTPHWAFSLGEDVALNRLRNNLPAASFPVRFTSLSGLNVRYRGYGLTVTGSLIGTYITERVDSGSAPADRKKLSPTLSLSYRPFASLPLYVRVLAKTTYRVPSFNDLYYRRLGNVLLRPERANEYNLGLTWSGAPFGFFDLFTFTADGYYHRVTDKIVAFPTTYVWKMANFGKVDITGLDLTVQAGIPFASRCYLHFAAAFTWQRAIDDTDPQSKGYHNQLPYTPRVNGSGSAVLDLPWVSIGYSLFAMGKRYSMAQNLPIYSMDGFAEHTLTLLREFKIKKCKLQLSGELVNFTNEQYSIIQYYPMPGRSYRLTLNVQL